MVNVDKTELGDKYDQERFRILGKFKATFVDLPQMQFFTLTKPTGYTKPTGLNKLSQLD